MTHYEFYNHADGIKSAIVAAVDVYMARAGISFSKDALLRQSDNALEDLSKDALFYGAEVFPDTTAAASVAGS